MGKLDCRNLNQNSEMGHWCPRQGLMLLCLNADSTSFHFWLELKLPIFIWYLPFRIFPWVTDKLAVKKMYMYPDMKFHHYWYAINIHTFKCVYLENLGKNQGVLDSNISCVILSSYVLLSKVLYIFVWGWGLIAKWGEKESLSRGWCCEADKDAPLQCLYWCKFMSKPLHF